MDPVPDRARQAPQDQAVDGCSARYPSRRSAGALPPVGGSSSGGRGGGLRGPERAASSHAAGRGPGGVSHGACHAGGCGWLTATGWSSARHLARASSDAFWATQLLGAVAVPRRLLRRETRLGVPRLSRILEVSDARAIAMDRESHRRLQESGLGALPALVAVTPSGTADHAGDDPDPGEPSVHPDDLGPAPVHVRQHVDTTRVCADERPGRWQRRASGQPVPGAAARGRGLLVSAVPRHGADRRRRTFPSSATSSACCKRAEAFVGNPVSWLRLIAEHRAVITPAPNFPLPSSTGSCGVRLPTSTCRPFGRSSTAANRSGRTSPSSSLRRSRRVGSRPRRCTRRTGWRSMSSSLQAHPADCGSCHGRRLTPPGSAWPTRAVLAESSAWVDHCRGPRSASSTVAGSVATWRPARSCCGRPPCCPATGTTRTPPGGGRRRLVPHRRPRVRSRRRALHPRTNERGHHHGRPERVAGRCRGSCRVVAGVRMGGVAACGVDLDGTEGVVVLAEYRGADGGGAAAASLPPAGRSRRHPEAGRAGPAGLPPEDDQRQDPTARGPAALRIWHARRPIRGA